MAKTIEEKFFSFLDLIKEKLLNNNTMVTNQLTTKQMVQEVADKLLKANNTVTTLEIKTELRKTFPNRAWYQGDVSQAMDELYYDGVYDYHDNGVYRVYSLPNTLPTPGVAFNATVNAIQKSPVTQVQTRVSKPKTAPSVQKVSKTKAIDLIQNSGGRFFGVTFTKKDGSERKMKCKIENGATPDIMGYLSVIDVTEDTTKKLNLQTLSEVRMNKTIYKVG